jgi:SAM-dependent methyltransferase
VQPRQQERFMEHIMTFRADVLQQLEELARTAILQAYASRRLNTALSCVKRSADLKRIERLKREVDPIYRRDRFSAAKYADFHPWVLRNLHRAAQLGLHKTPRLRILDIGAGPGYFIAAARALGHECIGIDVPDSCLTPLELRVYTELLNALNCRQHVSPVSIERFEPLPVYGGRYDLITAFLVCFNQHAKPDQWGVPEWRFFVENAMESLTDGGRLFLGLNENVERFGRLAFYDEPLLAYFQSVGTVNRARITITKNFNTGL